MISSLVLLSVYYVPIYYEVDHRWFQVGVIGCILIWSIISAWRGIVNYNIMAQKIRKTNYLVYVLPILLVIIHLVVLVMLIINISDGKICFMTETMLILYPLVFFFEPIILNFICRLVILHLNKIVKKPVEVKDMKLCTSNLDRLVSFSFATYVYTPEYKKEPKQKYRRL